MSSTSGKATGTVPKIRSTTSSSIRDENASPHRISNTPNNLQLNSGFDWQQSSGLPSTRPNSRQTRNIRQPIHSNSAAPTVFPQTEAALPFDSFGGRFSSDSSFRRLQTDITLDADRGFDDNNRRPGELIIIQQTHQPLQESQTQSHTRLDTKNNIAKIPDRNQVLSRLNQIRDYVKQTSALMDLLKTSPDPRHVAQVIKLTSMNADLKDSEKRLENLLNALNVISNESIPDAVLSPQSPVNDHQIRNRNATENTQHMMRMDSRSVSEEPVGAMSTASQVAKHQELKLKVEESQKKLLALQEHQAALAALQQKAQEQLREVQAQQGALLASSSANSVVGGVNENADNNRIRRLQDFLLSRNGVSGILGEQDELLAVEHGALAERLDELQGNKNAIDKLLQDILVLGDNPVQNGHNSNEEESFDHDDEAALYNACDKLDELNKMKSRLAQLQSMVTAAYRNELSNDEIKIALANVEDMRAVNMGNTEQNVGISPRQYQESRKPDNTVLSSDAAEGVLEATVMDIKRKTDQLNLAKRKLQQLKDIIGAVEVNDNRYEETSNTDMDETLQGNTVVHRPLHNLSRSDQMTAASANQMYSSTRKNKNEQTNSDGGIKTTPRRNEPCRRQLTLQAELQARRQQLEELMHKDQGRSSFLNQDTCSETGLSLPSLPETSATWGGSSYSQTALLASLGPEAETQFTSNSDFSDEQVSSSQYVRNSQEPNNLPRHRHQSMPPSLPPYVPWQQFWPKSGRDSADNQSSTRRNSGTWNRSNPDGSAPNFETAGSSGVTPRPPSEAGSAQSASWRPLQIQQQLEATNAMYQAMMQQWQWGPAGSSDPMWNLQGPMPLQQLHIVQTVSQCFQMLWMQHREIADLHAAIHNLQDKIEKLSGSRGEAVGGEQLPTPSHHQPLKVSLSTGIFSDNTSPQANGVSSAHSLPNLCDGPTSYVLQSPDNQHWMQQPPRHADINTTPNSTLSSILRHGQPVTTLNNQVPPGIRANNYWDNFRSYSRQNVLSTSSKSNEGHPHIPIPIVDRSHNPIRHTESQGHSSPSATANRMCTSIRSQKQKLNTEHRQGAGNANVVNNSPSRQRPIQSPQQRPTQPSMDLLYTELSNLMAQNRSRPEFLPQLFRELQSLSSDSSLCQQALQSIREIRARNSNRNVDISREFRARGLEDNIEINGSIHEEAESSMSISSPESAEGAVSLPIGRTSKVTQNVDNNSVHMPSHQDDMHNLILQIWPFLKMHKDDCCTPNLLESIRRLIISVLMQQSPNLNGFDPNHIDSLLDNSIVKFQGCWLRDVGEELISTVLEVLLNELNFYKLSDNVYHNRTQLSQESVHANVPVEEIAVGDDLSTVGGATNSHWLSPSKLQQLSTTWDTMMGEPDTVLSCNGELAEADQSHEDPHHNTTRSTNCNATTIATATPNATVVDSNNPDINSQPEGAVNDSSSDAEEDELEALGALVLETTNHQAPSTEDDAWNVEQDRELDQVPTRLEPGGPQHDSSQSNNVP